jgi:Protein of unknown function (DUF2934)
MEAQSDTLATAEARQRATEELAYKLWQLAGCPSDRDLTFWLHAEQQVMARQRDALSKLPAGESRLVAAGSKKAGTRRTTTAAAVPAATAPVALSS